MARYVALWLFLPALVFAQDKPAAGLSSKELDQAKKLIREYFEAMSPGERGAVAKKIAEIDRPSQADIKKLAPLCFNLMRRSGPIVDKKPKQKCTHPDFPGEYILQAPTSAFTKPTGLFISLHGGGENVGDGAQIQGLFGTPAQNFICIYPTVIQKTSTAWNTEREEKYVLAIIDELKRTFNIDTNRMYLAGHSMGGYGTWAIGGRHADLFAAISPMAGGLYSSGIIPNLKNTPIWVYHSTDDPQVPADQDIAGAKRLEEMRAKYGAFDFVWKLYNDIGHGLPKDGVKPIFDWMLKKTRNPYPKHVLWEGGPSYKQWFYWLHKETPGGLIEAKLDGNTITLDGDIGGLEVMISDKMVKMTEPVIVKVYGKEVFNAKVQYSLVALVESIAAKNDPEMYFVGRIKVP